MRAVWLLLLCVCAPGCSSRPSYKTCESVADRMIDIFTAQRTGGQSVPADVSAAMDAWKVVLKEKDPTKRALVDLCHTQMTDTTVECVLRAVDEKSLAACFQT